MDNRRRPLNQPHRRPQNAQTLRRLFLSLLPLPFLASPVFSQVSPPFVTWEGSEYSTSLTYVADPHTQYSLENGDGFLKTTGTTNECGILTVSLPSGFPAIKEPLDASWQMAGVYLNGGDFKYFYWNNKVYKGDDVDPSELNCAKVSELISIGWTWMSSASKGKVVYWEQGVFAPSSVYPVVVYGNHGAGLSGRTGIKKAKSNACGIVTFKYLYHGANNLTEKGYILKWDKPFILKKEATPVSTVISDDFQYANAKPFCKNGQLYLPETEEEYDDDQD